MTLPYDELGEVLSDRADVESQVENAALASIINDWLRTQSPDARTVFVHRYFYCMPLRDVAKKCAFSESKCKSILYRTRLSLKEALEKEGVDL